MKQDLSLNKKDLSADEIKKMKDNYSFWQGNADKFASSNEVSWGDVNMMKLEINNIIDYIKDGDLVLDAGCSNGFSTFNIVKQRDIKTEAFDYSEKAIAIAKKEQIKNDPDGKIKFTKGNVLNIDQPENKFDVAYTIRVLINLPNWKRQQEAIGEIARVLKPGGLYLMSEAFTGSLEKINALRALADLKPLTVHEFNLYIKENELEAFASKHFEIEAIHKFSSIYYVASRFLRYLTMKKGDQDSFDNEINNFFVKFDEAENSGDFGIQKLYVLRKKGI